MGDLLSKCYTPGDIYRYEPTERGLTFGDKPGLVEILSDNGGRFTIQVLSGLENFVARRGREIKVDKGSVFAEGLSLEDLSPTTVDSGLTFEDII